MGPVIVIKGNKEIKIVGENENTNGPVDLGNGLTIEVTEHRSDGARITTGQGGFTSSQTKTPSGRQHNVNGVEYRHERGS